MYRLDWSEHTKTFLETTVRTCTYQRPLRFSAFISGQPQEALVVIKASYLFENGVLLVVPCYKVVQYQC